MYRSFCLSLIYGCSYSKTFPLKFKQLLLIFCLFCLFGLTAILLVILTVDYFCILYATELCSTSHVNLGFVVM